MPPRNSDQDYTRDQEIRNQEQREDHELLIRLDERLQQINMKLDRYIEASSKDYVSKNEFIPVQRAVYAAIGFIVTGVMGGVLTILIKGTGH